MFANFRNRLVAVVAPELPALPSSNDRHYHRGNFGSFQQRLQDKFAYARPHFLQLLTQDELKASADHNVRPIIVPRDINLLPWGTGYAECVNSGKSEWNEDQGAFCRQVLSDPTNHYPDMPYTYFGIFDGHAGYGAALAASHQFHHILHEKLVDCLDLLLSRDDMESNLSNSHNNNSNKFLTNNIPHPRQFQRSISKDELIIGALESAFFHMDALIDQDRDRYRDAGGCTACVSLFINGKMYVANAGDSRAVLCQKKYNAKETIAHESQRYEDDSYGADGAFAIPFSYDHTPETERERLLSVAQYNPHLMSKHYAPVEYSRRPHKSDLGQRILCRQGTMKGWTYKTLTRDDLKMPVVTGEGKRSRLLGTLGVTRGFGDHDLLAIATGTLIKPFLTPQPEVNYRDLMTIVSMPEEHNEDGDYGVLVMGTDGLWDVSENDAVARTVFQTLHKYPTEKHRYTMAAQELVARARGKVNDYGHWRLADSKAAATVDDISVIVIPVYQYYKEHVEWEQRCLQLNRERLERLQTLQATEAKEEDTLSTLVNGLLIDKNDKLDDTIDSIIGQKNSLQNPFHQTNPSIAQLQVINEKFDSNAVEQFQDANHTSLNHDEIQQTVNDLLNKASSSIDNESNSSTDFLKANEKGQELSTTHNKDESNC